MKNHVLTIDLLGKHDAVLVVARDARAMTPVALGIQQIVGGDQADTRARSRVSGLRDRVDPVFLDPRDTRVFGTPVLVWSIAADRGLIPDLVDCFTIGRKC